MRRSDDESKSPIKVPTLSRLLVLLLVIAKQSAGICGQRPDENGPIASCIRWEHWSRVAVSANVWRLTIWIIKSWFNLFSILEINRLRSTIEWSRQDMVCDWVDSVGLLKRYGMRVWYDGKRCELHGLLIDTEKQQQRAWRFSVKIRGGMKNSEIKKSGMRRRNIRKGCASRIHGNLL